MLDQTTVRQSESCFIVPTVEDNTDLNKVAFTNEVTPWATHSGSNRQLSSNDKILA